MLTLYLPTNYQLKLRDELSAAGRREIGGILMGEQLAPGEFKVTEMTFQRHGGMIARFVRNANLALMALQQFFTRTGHCYQRYNYMGEWHSHPSFDARPSRKDHESMVDVACHQNIGANFVVLLIVRIDNAYAIEGSVTVYLPDGSASRGVLALDAMQTISDTDQDDRSCQDKADTNG